MSNELKEAVERIGESTRNAIASVERLRSVSDGKEPDDVYDDDSTQCRVDQAVVCSLYLEEHPADDAEPITAEWLEAVSSEFDSEWTFHVKTSIGKYCSVLLQKPNEWWFKVGGEPVARPTTRGDVRRLCTALGVPLKQPAKVEA